MRCRRECGENGCIIVYAFASVCVEMCNSGVEIVYDTSVVKQENIIFP